MAELIELAKKYGTDKWGQHSYAAQYERHFAPLRNAHFNLLEIGIGGYRDPSAGGASVLMWRDYFPKATIVAIDIHEKRLQGERIRVFRGDQSDPDFLIDVNRRAGPFRIIIDDGSHLNHHVIASFQCLFPLLELGGLYAIEDLQTSYWANYGGTMYDLDAPGTSINFLKRLVDALNYAERDSERTPPTYLDRHTVGLHFYHNLCFVEKDHNDEPSNIAGARIQVRPSLAPEICARILGRSDAEIDSLLPALGGVDGIAGHVATFLRERTRVTAAGGAVLVRIAVEHGASSRSMSVPLCLERPEVGVMVPELELRMTAYDWARLLAGDLSNVAFLSGRATIRDDHGMWSHLRGAMLGRASAV